MFILIYLWPRVKWPSITILSSSIMTISFWYSLYIDKKYEKILHFLPSPETLTNFKPNKKVLLGELDSILIKRRATLSFKGELKAYLYMEASSVNVDSRLNKSWSLGIRFGNNGVGGGDWIFTKEYKDTILINFWKKPVWPKKVKTCIEAFLSSI